MRPPILALCLLATSVRAGDGPGDAHAPRPLPIQGASPAIVRATVSGPRFHAPELSPGIEDYHNPRRLEVRTRNFFDVEGPVVSAIVHFTP